jgi:hypothetical protein
MKHFAVPSFWDCYHKLPADVKEQADKNYALLKENPSLPSLRFKKIGNYYSVRINIRYRALGIEAAEGMIWFWAGTHAAYDELLK